VSAGDSKEASQTPQPADPPSSSAKKGWFYDNHVASLLTPKMISARPGDLCPKYSSAIATRFWQGLFKATANAESGYDPKNGFTEKFKSNSGSQQVSQGLMQISVDDGRNYRGGCSAITSTATIQDPHNNLRCSATIMDRLIGRSSNMRASLGRYWSTIRDRKVDSQLRREVPQCF
jgi:hypothetical protein